MKKALSILLILAILLLPSCAASGTGASVTASEGSSTASDRDLSYLDEPPQYDADGNLVIEHRLPTVTMRSVDSSCFSEIGYDAEISVLYVRFKDSGALYAYYHFDDWDSFSSTDSLGTYYNKHIKGRYDCHRYE